MELRPELMPPTLDEEKVARLAKLADQIDGAAPGQWEDDLAKFNRLAGTGLKFEDLQGIYGAEDYEDYVRRVLHDWTVKPADGVTREELAEVVRRSMPRSGYADREAYMAVLDANVPSPKASNLIFYPPDYDAATNTWGGGRQMGEYDPTPEQIVEWALSSGGSGNLA